MKKKFPQLFNILLALTLSCLPALSAEEKEDTEAAEQKAKEAQEAQQAEEEEIKAQFDYSFNDIANQIVTVSCESSHGRSSGSGFIAKMDGKTYLFTNQHVIMGADKISFKTTTGTSLRPRGVQLSKTLDIARLPLAEGEGFSVSRNVAMGAPIAVFGNSEGGGVATELYGKVRGVGADSIEVSAAFVSGNSGSPVLNLDQEVVGIASWVSWKHNDDDGSETRRFCYRLTGNEWETVNWKKYNEKYGGLLSETQEMVDSIFEIANTWYANPFSRVSAENHSESELENWSASHNRMINRINRMREKGRATTHELNNVNKQIRKDMSDSAEDLSAVCLKRARQMRFLATQKELSGYLRKEFNDFAKRLERSANSIERYGNKLAKQDFFSFRK